MVADVVFCEGCRRMQHCCTCTSLPQIKRVEKWQARDGSYHDSLEGAEKHQLSAELIQALKTCDGYPDRQAQHLLLHFDIVRKGDREPQDIALTPSRRGHPKFWGFFLGCVFTAMAGIAFLHFAN